MVVRAMVAIAVTFFPMKSGNGVDEDAEDADEEVFCTFFGGAAVGLVVGVREDAGLEVDVGEGGARGDSLSTAGDPELHMLPRCSSLVVPSRVASCWLRTPEVMSEEKRLVLVARSLVSPSSRLSDAEDGSSLRARESACSAAPPRRSSFAWGCADAGRRLDLVLKEAAQLG